MRIYLKNNPAKFHADPISRSLGFFEGLLLLSNDKMSSDIGMGSVPGQKFKYQGYEITWNAVTSIPRNGRSRRSRSACTRFQCQPLGWCLVHLHVDNIWVNNFRQGTKTSGGNSEFAESQMIIADSKTRECYNEIFYRCGQMTALENCLHLFTICL